MPPEVYVPGSPADWLRMSDLAWLARTHNLRTLFDLLPADVLMPSDVQVAAGLSDYAGREPLSRSLRFGRSRGIPRSHRSGRSGRLWAEHRDQFSVA